MTVHSFGITDVGLKREKNEDNFLLNEELNLYVVADGMGGHAGGEVASAICVNTIEEIIGELLAEGGSVELLKEKIRYAIRLAGQRIHEQAGRDQGRRGMGTTAVVLLLRDAVAYVAHVGDSRVYMHRKGVLTQLTEDHSLINETLKAGLITPEEAKNHKMKNIITRSLGYQEDVEVDVQTVELQEEDGFLLCSDGLTGHVEDPELEELLGEKEIERVGRRLVEIACSRGGDDNITLVVVRNRGSQ
jgi:serine/threonine protein phosphatase PrpC